MKENLNSSFKELDDFFARPFNANQKAWAIIHDFYHFVLTHMERNNITKSDLAKRLNKSRSAISQMFNKSPNVSIKKLVEIADAIDLEFKIVPTDNKERSAKPVYVMVPYSLGQTSLDSDYIILKDQTLQFNLDSNSIAQMESRTQYAEC